MSTVDSGELDTFIVNAVKKFLMDMGYEVDTHDNQYVLSHNNELVVTEPLTGRELQQYAIWIERMRENQLLKLYHFYWKNGSVSSALGTCVSDAATHAGIGNGAVAALEMYSCGMDPIAFYDVQAKAWTIKEGANLAV